MTDDLWVADGRKRWVYTKYDPNTYLTDVAVIEVRPDGWHLFLNFHYIASFNSWAEARDATPMMIKLHGYESRS